jgi:hypothetical protein
MSGLELSLEVVLVDARTARTARPPARPLLLSFVSMRGLRLGLNLLDSRDKARTGVGTVGPGRGVLSALSCTAADTAHSVHGTPSCILARPPRVQWSWWRR